VYVWPIDLAIHPCISLHVVSDSICVHECVTTGEMVLINDECCGVGGPMAHIINSYKPFDLL
jgi:hypothetical protein